jgi:hypothetical protein
MVYNFDMLASERGKSSINIDLILGGDWQGSSVILMRRGDPLKCMGVQVATAYISHERVYFWGVFKVA